MTDTFTLVLVGALAAIAAFLRLKFSGKKLNRSPKPPKNTVADVARKISDEEFQEKLDEIEEDISYLNHERDEHLKTKHMEG